MNSPKKKGLFITFEGGEGAGKSTQIRILKDFLEKKGFPVVDTHDPGGTFIGNRIRNIVLEKELKELSLKTELFLFLAARAQLVEEIIKPALIAGHVVICDRYYHSTFAYQCGARGLDMDIVRQFNAYAIENIHPDITFLFDLPPKEGFDRMRPKNSKGKEINEDQITLSLHLSSDHQRINIDRIERAGDEFHEKVRQTFLRLAKEEPERIIVLNAGRPVEEIAAQVGKVVWDLLEIKNLERPNG